MRSKLARDMAISWSHSLFVFFCTVSVCLRCCCCSRWDLIKNRCPAGHWSGSSTGRQSLESEFQGMSTFLERKSPTHFDVKDLPMSPDVYYADRFVIKLALSTHSRAISTPARGCTEFPQHHWGLMKCQFGDMFGEKHSDSCTLNVCRQGDIWRMIFEKGWFINKWIKRLGERNAKTLTFDNVRLLPTFLVKWRLFEIAVKNVNYDYYCTLFATQLFTSPTQFMISYLSFNCLLQLALFYFNWPPRPVCRRLLFEIERFYRLISW